MRIRILRSYYSFFIGIRYLIVTVFYRLYLLDSHAKIFHGEDIDALNKTLLLLLDRHYSANVIQMGRAPRAASGYGVAGG
jgi:hypothetical protein